MATVSTNLDYDAVIAQIINIPDEEEKACTHPAGHCFGSDGGSGIPELLKIATGRGGEFDMDKLSANKKDILASYKAERCQYCQLFYVNPV